MSACFKNFLKLFSFFLTFLDSAFSIVYQPFFPPPPPVSFIPYPGLHGEPGYFRSDTGVWYPNPGANSPYGSRAPVPAQATAAPSSSPQETQTDNGINFGNILSSITDVANSLKPATQAAGANGLSNNGSYSSSGTYSQPGYSQGGTYSQGSYSSQGSYPQGYQPQNPYPPQPTFINSMGQGPFGNIPNYNGDNYSNPIFNQPAIEQTDATSGGKEPRPSDGEPPPNSYGMNVGGSNGSPPNAGGPNWRQNYPPNVSTANFGGHNGPQPNAWGPNPGRPNFPS